jgi:hypothetical protein
MRVLQYRSQSIESYLILEESQHLLAVCVVCRSDKYQCAIVPALSFISLYIYSLRLQFHFGDLIRRGGFEGSSFEINVQRTSYLQIAHCAVKRTM